MKTRENFSRNLVFHQAASDLSSLLQYLFCILFEYIPHMFVYVRGVSGGACPLLIKVDCMFLAVLIAFGLAFLSVVIATIHAPLKTHKLSKQQATKKRPASLFCFPSSSQLEFSSIVLWVDGGPDCQEISTILINNLELSHRERLYSYQLPYDLSRLADYNDSLSIFIVSGSTPDGVRIATKSKTFSHVIICCRASPDIIAEWRSFLEEEIKSIPLREPVDHDDLEISALISLINYNAFVS